MAATNYPPARFARRRGRRARRLERTVRRYMADGQLDAVRLGRKTLRIKVDSIERFIGARPVGNYSSVSRRTPV